jgi:hypothetical protein
MCLALLVWLAAAGSISAQTANVRTFKGRLSPVPVPAATSSVTGTGSVIATVSGTKLTVTGTFQGLHTPATVARIHRSPKPGIRGPVVFELTIAHATSGTIAGAFDLTAAQVQEVAQGRYYVQLHSEKAPEGNLWGWLLVDEVKK